MRVAVSRRLKKIGPVITKVMVDILEKGLDENLNGEDLKAYADVQMDFVKIVIGSQD